MRSKASRLAKALGGEWTYDGRASWWCNDGKRHVSRCSAGVDEYDNEVGPAQYWLYEKGKTPKRVESFLLGVATGMDLLRKLCIGTKQRRGEGDGEERGQEEVRED